MAVTLRQLRIFVTIAHGRTLAEAAEHLHLTRPAVSLALSELESQCGRRLFDRHRQRLHINEDGTRLLPLADELLARAGDIEQAFQIADGYRGHLRVGASHTIGHQLLPFVLRDFRRRCGPVQVEVRIANSRSICAGLEAFDLDLGLIEGRADNAALHLAPWRRDRMRVLAAPGHPLAASTEPLSVAALDGQSWVLRERGSGTREQFMLKIAAHVRQWHVAYEFSAAEAIINAVSAGLGLTCISELEARDALAGGRVVALPVRSSMSRELSLVTHRDKYQGPLVAQFIDTCTALRL